MVELATKAASFVKIANKFLRTVAVFWMLKQTLYINFDRFNLKEMIHLIIQAGLSGSLIP